MSIINLPTMDPRGKTEAEQIKELRDYLAVLTKRLTYALNNIDETNLNSETRAKLGKSKDFARIEEQLENGLGAAGGKIQDAYETLHDEIVKRADEITVNYENAIDINEQQLRSEFTEELNAKASIGELEEVRTSVLNQTADLISVEIGKTGAIYTDADGNEQSYLKKLLTYFEFTDSGLKIRKVDNDQESPFSSLFSNTSLQFMQNGNVVSEISNYMMLIRVLSVLEKLSIGNSNTPTYTWEIEQNGSLSLVGRGAQSA